MIWNKKFKPIPGEIYFSDEEILIIGQKSQDEQIQAFSFASNYCNKNADAPN